MDVNQQKHFRLKLEGKLRFVRLSLNKPNLIAYLKKHKISVEIPEIEKAIARLNDGKYGLCEDCGNDISSQRLEVRPDSFLRRMFVKKGGWQKMNDNREDEKILAEIILQGVKEVMFARSARPVSYRKIWEDVIGKCLIRLNMAHRRIETITSGVAGQDGGRKIKLSFPDFYRGNENMILEEISHLQFNKQKAFLKRNAFS